MANDRKELGWVTASGMHELTRLLSAFVSSFFFCQSSELSQRQKPNDSFNR
jgi:hypothetical protein